VAHRHLPGADWTALALDIDPEPTSDEAARMLDWAGRQNTTLAHYIAQGDVIPIALGAVFSDADAVHDHLRARAADLQATAAQVAGRCEYVLHVRPNEDAFTPPELQTDAQTGLSYLRARRDRRDRRVQRSADRQSLLRQLETTLTPLAQQRRVHDVAGKPLLADLSLLVARDRTGDLTTALHPLAQRAHALGLKLRLIGPNPAYSFVAQPHV
jgi:hypothetical protein